MRYSHYQIVFQEVPDEVSLALHITGCPLRCEGCHSSSSWNQNLGQVIDQDHLNQLLNQYLPAITCVLFLGGEWNPDTLVQFLKIARARGLKTALYTGLDYDAVSPVLLEHLDYLKYGPYITIKGGLSSKTTNQVFLNLNTNQKLNHLFTEG